MIPLTMLVDIILDVLTTIRESQFWVEIFTFTAIIWSPNCAPEMASYIIDMRPLPSFLSKNIQHFCLYPVCLAVKWLFGEETSPLSPPTRGELTVTLTRNDHNRMRYFTEKLIVIKHCTQCDLLQNLCNLYF